MAEAIPASLQWVAMLRATPPLSASSKANDLSALIRRLTEKL
jgi:hypothetical protein